MTQEDTTDNNTNQAKVVGEATSTAIPGGSLATETISAMPGIIILVHGVNSQGEWFNKAEEGLCVGLDERLARDKYENLQSKLEAAEYMMPFTYDGKVNVGRDANSFIKKEGNSPIIRFWFGYRAHSSELAESDDGKSRKKASVQSRVYLDEKFAWGGGPFANGSSFIPDCWGKYTHAQLFGAVTATHVNTSTRIVYDTPPRSYYVHAADRLASLVQAIRQMDDTIPISVICHSQGNMIGLTSILIGAARNAHYVADSYVLCNPPYNPKNLVFYHYAQSSFGELFSGNRQDGVRVLTLRHIVDAVRAAGKISQQKLTLDQINNGNGKGGVKFGFEKNGVQYYKIAEQQTLKKVHEKPKEDNTYTDEERYPFVDRDNRGKIFLNFNLADIVIGTSAMQGMGWRGLTEGELAAIDPDGDTFFQRAWVSRFPVGLDPKDTKQYGMTKGLQNNPNSKEPMASGKAGKNYTPRWGQEYHVWKDHWLIKKTKQANPDAVVRWSNQKAEKGTENYSPNYGNNDDEQYKPRTPTTKDGKTIIALDPDDFWFPRSLKGTFKASDSPPSGKDGFDIFLKATKLIGLKQAVDGFAYVLINSIGTSINGMPDKNYAVPITAPPVREPLYPKLSSKGFVRTQVTTSTTKPIIDGNGNHRDIDEEKVYYDFLEDEDFDAGQENVDLDIRGKYRYQHGEKIDESTLNQDIAEEQAHTDEKNEKEGLAPMSPADKEQARWLRAEQFAEDRAVYQMLVNQAKDAGVEEGSRKWKKMVDERYEKFITFTVRDSSHQFDAATDHGTIVARQFHYQKVLAYDVAIGPARYTKAQMLALRRFADWRLAGEANLKQVIPQVSDEVETLGKLAALYYNIGGFGDGTGNPPAPPPAATPSPAGSEQGYKKDGKEESKGQVKSGIAMVDYYPDQDSNGRPGRRKLTNDKALLFYEAYPHLEPQFQRNDI